MTDATGTPTGRIDALVSATAVGIAGVFGIVAWSWLLSAVLGVDPGVPTVPTLVVSTVAGGLGTASVAAIYIHGRDLGIGYLDLPRPDVRDLGYALGGIASLVVLNVAIELFFREIGVDTPDHVFLRQARANPEVLLVLIPLSYLVIGPGEELLYRNVVQKSLYEAFTGGGAVLIASTIFAVAHVGSYLVPSAPLATLSGLLMVFALSLVIGVVYLRTESLPVAAFVHGSFDAVAFGVAYLRLA